MTEITMPQMGYDMQQGTLVRWLKNEGSSVKQGEPIAEIETDKAVVEFQSYAEGILQKVLVEEGTVVEVGDVIAVIDSSGKATPSKNPDSTADKTPLANEKESRLESKQSGKQLKPSRISSEKGVVVGDSTKVKPSSGNGVKASPLARKIAKEMGIDLSELTGTGPSGRITKSDVLLVSKKDVPDGLELADESTAEGAVLAKPEPIKTHRIGPSDFIPLSKMRQQIARITVKSKQEIPHYYVSAEVDMTEAMRLRTQLNESDEFQGAKISVNDLVVKATVEALKKHPKFNSSLSPAGIQIHESINIGIAMTMEQGLMVPAIRDCGDKTLKDLSVASRDLTDRAKGGSLRAEEYTGGTFAISNLGMFDITSFIAVIHPPQVAVLAVGSVGKRPFVRGGELVIADTMTITLSADHRAVDGADGAVFIGEVKHLLESPFLLLL